MDNCSLINNRKIKKKKKSPSPPSPEQPGRALNTHMDLAIGPWSYNVQELWQANPSHTEEELG